MNNLNKNNEQYKFYTPLSYSGYKYTDQLPFLVKNIVQKIADANKKSEEKFEAAVTFTIH